MFSLGANAALGSSGSGGPVSSDKDFVNAERVHGDHLEAQGMPFKMIAYSQDAPQLHENEPCQGVIQPPPFVRQIKQGQPLRHKLAG